MFKADIEHYYELFSFNSSKRGLVIHTGLELLLKKRDSVSHICNMHEYRDFLITNDGLWLGHQSNSDMNSYSKFFDFYDIKTNQEDLPFSVSGVSYMSDEFVIGRELKWLYIYDKNRQELKKVLGRFFSNIEFFRKMIFALETRKKEIKCFDLSLNENWSHKILKSCYTNSIENGPQLFNNTIILNIGEEKNEQRGNFELNAYKTEDFSLKWQLILSTTPYCSNVIGDKVYISVQDRIMVVSAETGKILVDVPHQLGSNTHHFLYPYKDYLVAACETSAKINIFSKEGQELFQEIKIPDPLTVITNRKPVECNDNFYILLANRDMNMRLASSSLLELSRDEFQPNKLTPELPKRPLFYISTLTKKNGDHEHLVTVSHHDLDEIVLYGTIVLKEIVIEVSSQIELRKRDEDHNGTLHFVVDPDPLPKDMLADAREKLQVIAERIDWHTKRVGETAGKDQKPFNVKIEIK